MSSSFVHVHIMFSVASLLTLAVFSAVQSSSGVESSTCKALRGDVNEFLTRGFLAAAPATFYPAPDALVKATGEAMTGVTTEYGLEGVDGVVYKLSASRVLGCSVQCPVCSSVTGSTRRTTTRSAAASTTTTVATEEQQKEEEEVVTLGAASPAPPRSASLAPTSTASPRTTPAAASSTAVPRPRRSTPTTTAPPTWNDADEEKGFTRRDSDKLNKCDVQDLLAYVLGAVTFVLATVSSIVGFCARRLQSSNVDLLVNWTRSQAELAASTTSNVSPGGLERLFGPGGEDRRQRKHHLGPRGGFLRHGLQPRLRRRWFEPASLVGLYICSVHLVHHGASGLISQKPNFYVSPSGEKKKGFCPL